MRLAVFGLIGGLGIFVLGMASRPEKMNGDQHERAVPTAIAGGRLAADESAVTESVTLKPVLPKIEDGSAVEYADQVSGSRQNMQKKVAMLKQSIEFLKSIPGYTANISKREEVRGDLLDEQVVFIKCRQNPFSVYLHWSKGDEGREVIYIEGTNDGKIIAHDGGWKARIPAFHLEPDCPLAMRDTRYPASCAGIRFLIDTMLGVHEGDLVSSNFASCEVEADVEFDNRPCLKFTTKYHAKSVSPVYRKSVTLFDRERSIPLHSEHYTWADSQTSQNDDSSDETTLIERYSFRDFTIHESLTDHDFDRSNKGYNFR